MSDAWLLLFFLPFVIGFVVWGYFAWVEKYRPEKSERWQIDNAKAAILEAEKEKNKKYQRNRIYNKAREELEREKHGKVS